MSDSFEIMYAAHTATCTFLLDADGICRRIALVPNSKRNLQSKGKDAARAAGRCVGAQYVASLDPSVAGMLAEMPRVGAAMLFARVDEKGRVSLVRTGVVTRFEGHREDPFADTHRHPPSTTVETSAPVITPSAPSPRRQRETSLPPPPPIPRADLYQEQHQDRTQPIQALRSEDIQLDDELDTTAKYEPPNGRRPTWPSPGASLSPPQPLTLRQPPATVAEEEQDDPYTGPRVPRRSEPYAPRTRSDRVLRGTADAPPPRIGRTPSYPPLDKVAAVRRRGDR